MQLSLEYHKKLLFGESDRKDFRDREALLRRAAFWKYMAMALESKQKCEDKALKSIYENALANDLKSAPPMFAVNGISHFAIKAFNDRNKPKIEIAK